MTGSNSTSISKSPTKVSSATVNSAKTRVMWRPGNSENRRGSATDSIREVQVGDLINNRFELVEELGSGGMGKVFKARDLRQVEAGDRDPWLALKTINPQFASHDQAFAALQQEAKKTQKLAHPNIVSVYDFDRDGDLPFMTMELLKGESLDKTIKQHPQGLPLNQAMELIKQVCQAISYAHKFGVIHADLKPANLFLDTGGRLKVLDFGIAQALHFETSAFDAHSLQALTPSYASVSLLLGERPSKQDDLYAIGCIFYLLLRGVHPYDRRKASEAQTAEMKPRRIRELNMAQWTALKSLLAFEKDPQLTIERFESRFFGLQKKNSAWVAMVSAGLLAALLFLLFIFSWLKNETIDELSRRLSSPNLATIKSGIEEIQSLDTDEQAMVLNQSRQAVIDNLEKDMEQLKTARDYHAVRRKLNILLPLYIDSAKLKNLDRGFRKSLQNYTNNLEYQLEKRFERREFEDGPPYLAQHIKDVVLLNKASAVLQRYSVKQVLAKEVGLAQYLGQPERARKIAKQAIELFPNEKDRFQNSLSAKEGSTISQPLMQNRPDGIGQNLNQLAELWRQQKPADQHQFRQFLDQLKTLDSSLYHVINSSLVEFSRNGHSGSSLAAAYAVIPRPQSTPRRNNPGDNCKSAFANLGKQQTYRCSDSLRAGGRGPEMVVVLGTGKLPSFAVSRTEISIKDFNQYCRFSGVCTVQPNPTLPITRISAKQAEAYAGWLSEQSGRRYQLPNAQQWQHYAKDDNGIEDHNCLIQSGGRTIRGNKLRSVSEGYPNSLGLINVVGNAAEWVRGQSGHQAMGGSAAHGLQQCARTVYSSNLVEDHFIGFRLVRALNTDAH